MTRPDLHKHQTWHKQDENEARFEFFDKDTKKGGLITLTRFEQVDQPAYLRVDVWSVDKGVEVIAPLQNMPAIYVIYRVAPDGTRTPVGRSLNQIAAEVWARNLRKGIQMHGSPDTVELETIDCQSIDLLG